MLFLSFPIHYFLELTPQCNNRCLGCGDIFSDRNIPPLSANQWQMILNKISPHAVRLRISGGEPTLHPEFETIIKFVRSLDIGFTLFTNARWQSPEKLICFLKDTPQCRGLLISLHGDCAGIHEAFSGINGSFDETVSNIRMAVNSGISISTSTIITKANYNRINEIIAFISSLGIRRLFFARYLPVKNNAIMPSRDQLKQAMNDIQTWRKDGIRVGFSVCLPQCFMRSSSAGCLSGVTYCVIDPHGNVRPCTHSPLICGNLFEQSLEQIWHGRDMQRWREMIPVQCHDCLEFSKCHGGCRAAAISAGMEKDPLMGNPILKKEQSPPEISELYEGAYPVRHFIIRQESFGYVLIYENQILPVAHQAKPILDMLDGSLTLLQIKERFGQDGLNFVGALYQKGFVEMETSSA